MQRSATYFYGLLASSTFGGSAVQPWIPDCITTCRIVAHLESKSLCVDCDVEEVKTPISSGKTEAYGLSLAPSSRLREEGKGMKGCV
jgi:hypothetical protein